MNSRTLLTLSAALLTALPLAGAAQPTPTRKASPITLRYKWTPGEVLSYKMTMDMNMAMSGQGANGPRTLPSFAQHMVMDYDQTVQSINPVDGSATLTEHITQMTATLNGQPLPGLDAMANAYKEGFTIVMSPAGKMLSMQFPPSLASKLPGGLDMSKMSGMAPATLPSFPAHVGDTWQDSASLPLFNKMPGMPELQMTVFSSLAGISAGTHPVAGIHQTYQGTLDSAVPVTHLNMTGQFHGDSLVKFDIGHGSVLAQDGTVTMTTMVTMPKMPTTKMARTMQMKMQMTNHLERLPNTP